MDKRKLSELLVEHKENAILHPPSSALRPYGLCAGDFIVPENFNQSLPEDIIREYEGFLINSDKFLQMTADWYKMFYKGVS